MTDLNLNHLAVEAEVEMPAARLRPDIHGSVSVLFHEIESGIVQMINAYPVVVGCVAWLTSEPILDALSRKRAVSLIVQKEDFLRPDCGNWSTSRLRKQYAALPEFCHYTAATGYNVAGSPDSSAVRCCGIKDKTGKTPPRMHHKFFVFCDISGEDEDGNQSYVPEAVCTGSFNPTRNASRSLENVIRIADPGVAWAYYYEWMHVLGLSESLDWKTEYVNPEYRLGT